MTGTTKRRDESNIVIIQHEGARMAYTKNEIQEAIRLKKCVERNIENVEANITSFKLFYENIKSISTKGDKR